MRGTHLYILRYGKIDRHRVRLRSDPQFIPKDDLFQYAMRVDKR